MAGWNRALDAAGIDEAGLREDYSRQREQARAFKREIVIAADLLLPARIVPHTLAAIAFMHRTDDLIDSGPVEGRQDVYKRWDNEVLDALADGESANPQLRPLLHTVAAYPVVGDRVRGYLASAEKDLHFTGFATDADYQEYVDGYSLPAFMLIATLLGPDRDQEAYRAACRVYIEAIQRLDFVNDLAQDLADGRLTIPEETLKQHGVTRADLEQARGLRTVYALISDQLDRVEQGLGGSGAVLDLVPPAHRAMFRCMIRLDELTVAAARRDIPALLRRSASPGKPAALRVLVTEYLRARHARRARGRRWSDGAGG